jgi:hypothetical protein
MHQMFGPKPEKVFEFLDRIPKLRPRPMGIQQQILVPKVFVPDYIRPDLLLPSVEFPDPLRHETDVHDFCVDDT